MLAVLFVVFSVSYTAGYVLGSSNSPQNRELLRAAQQQLKALSDANASLTKQLSATNDTADRLRNAEKRPAQSLSFRQLIYEHVLSA